MKKRVFYNELAYFAGFLLIASGTSFMTLADFGLSMIASPSYILHLGLSDRLPFLSFGVCDYLIQTAVILLMSLILRRFRLTYFFSFVSSVLYGCILDIVLIPLSLLPAESMVLRVIYFLLGLACTPAGVALLFRTYITPGAHEMFVKEVAAHFKRETGRVKTAYDCTLCAVSIVLSFAFCGLGHFRGMGVGTIICALVNGSIISMYSRLYDRVFDFRDRFALRKYFTSMEENKNGSKNNRN